MIDRRALERRLREARLRSLAKWFLAPPARAAASLLSIPIQRRQRRLKRPL